MYLHDSVNGHTVTVARRYESAFTVTPVYANSLPDVLTSAPTPGAQVSIQQVGISNFRLPLRFRTATNKRIVLEASVMGSVSLAAHLRGIHMGRIIRLFYEHQNRTFNFGTLRKILSQYLTQIETTDARLRLTFAFPLRQRALRSKLVGYQYYPAAIEATLDADGRFRRFLEFDFVYSSACPCSAELAEHARDARGIFAVPHSQRSKARVKIELAPGAMVSLEDIHAHCLAALKTETQVMVKRVDEQAFAELNGAYLKFVEDAARLLYAQLDADPRISDFQAACSHLESLHSHDAISVICKGLKDGFPAKVDDFRSLIC